MSRIINCVCGQSLYLRNSQCVTCGREAGYSEQHRDLLSLDLAVLPEGVLAPPGGAFHFARDPQGEREGLWHRCANSQTPSACNWLVPWTMPAPGATTAPMFCLSCRLNRTIPDYSDPVRAENWQKVEMAKRRLVASLLEFGLPVQPGTEGAGGGLMFDLLASLPDGSRPMTGHDNGLITINIDEADDVTRESVRKSMGENYRTVLGHIRHEVGHYYWDVLISGSAFHDRYRELFGDESIDYGEALQRHYAEGAPADWPMRHISAYASTHPWEDWAETWAHYMHMIDGLDTAESLGMNLGSSAIESTKGRHSSAGPSARHTPGAPAPAVPLKPKAAKAAAVEGKATASVPPKAATAPKPVAAPAAPKVGPDAPFDELFENWLKLSQAVNQMARALGERDLYPFIVSEPVRQKLAFVHEVIGAQGRRS